MSGATIIRNGNTYSTGSYREIFESAESAPKLRVYIKSGLKIYEAVIVNEARLEREEFCASKFTFTVMKDDVISFNQGDAVSVKYDGEVIFYGFVFTKKRDKDGLIETTCYDQLRYLKNKRTYTRSSATLSEVVNGIVKEYKLRGGDVARTGAILGAMAAERISLLDVIRKGAEETERRGGGRYELYDDGGYLTLKSALNMKTGVLIDAHLAEDFVYEDTIDEGVYNMIELYNDTKRLNQRWLVRVSDAETMGEWGTLILSQNTTEPETALRDAKQLLEKYNRVNREIVLKGAAGNTAVRGGSIVYISMTMGDLALNGEIRAKKAVHRFENNAYLMDVYLDGSEIG